jgi:hypothetical protein
VRQIESVAFAGSHSGSELLGLEEVEQVAAAGEAHAEETAPAERAVRAAKRRMNRGSLPAHLPRTETIVDIDDKACPCCRNALHCIGEGPLIDCSARWHHSKELGKLLSRSKRLPRQPNERIGCFTQHGRRRLVVRGFRGVRQR